jgi:hypothetical protein
VDAKQTLWLVEGEKKAIVAARAGIAVIAPVASTAASPESRHRRWQRQARRSPPPRLQGARWRV